MDVTDWDRVLFELEQFLITNGAGDYLGYFLKSMYPRIRSGEIVVILAPIDDALGRLVSRSRKSLDQISNSEEGRTILENFLSSTPIKQTQAKELRSPAYLAINGAHLATAADLDKLNYTASVKFGNLFVETVDGIIKMPNQLEALQQTKIVNPIVSQRRAVIGDNLVTKYDDLPNPIIRKIVLDLSLNDIISNCRVNRLFNSIICSDEDFWNEKIRRDFPHQQIMAGGSWKETYRILSPKLYSFGSNIEGQLGYSTTNTIMHGTDQLTPRRVDALATASFVACGSDHTAVISGGRLYTFGNGGYGQLGYGFRISHVEPRLVDELDNVSFVACGWHHTAAISEGRLYTFGYNAYGALGHGTEGLGVEEGAASPTLVKTLDNVTMVSCGTMHTAAISNGRLYTFGLGQDGQLGHGDDNTQDQLRPKLVETLENVTFVSCGHKHTAVISDGQLYTFGLGLHGQLGHRVLQNENAPRPVAGLDELGHGDSVACGHSHTAVIRNSELYTFGDGQYGELGHDKRQVQEAIQRRPQLVKALDNVTYVACGEGFTAAIANNQLYTFGNNSHGQLGNGHTGRSYVRIKPLDDVDDPTMVSCGKFYMAILAQ